MKRRICVFTGTRAEYGLLRPLIDEIRREKNCKLQLLVSGMHLSKDFGSTYKEIEKDGLKIDAKVDMRLDSDTPEGICRSTAFGITGIGRVYKRLQPELVVVLGDRYEAFAAAFAATVARIPIAHLHGGEATFGLIDEAIRHSITKMSYLHFTSTEEYRKRVIQLGEAPSRVFNVGAIGLDNIRSLPLLTKDRLERELDIRFMRHNLLVTFHPLTLEKGNSKIYFKNLLNVIDTLKETFIIFTKANADTEGRVINRMIDAYVAKRHGRAAAFMSMGRLKYLSTMQFVDGVVGNSSSGIIEAPSFKIGTINIGDRQAGRIRPASVIDCKPTGYGIRKAIERLYSASFRRNLNKVNNPYGCGSTVKKIMSVIKNADLSDMKKVFYNLR